MSNICTLKTRFPIILKLNGIWSRRKFSFLFWTKLKPIWPKIERKTVAMIIFRSICKEMEICLCAAPKPSAVLARGEKFSESRSSEPNSDCNYTSPIDLAPSGIAFGTIINRKCAITIEIWHGFTRFRKDVLVVRAEKYFRNLI